MQKGAKLFQLPQADIAAYTYDESLTLRDLWPNEATDFTPWLEGNIIIPTILQMIENQSFEFWKREVPVGDYRMDMIYQSEKSRYIIENQFGLSDNKHFGQILMYRYLTKMNNILWICDSVSLEHQKILKEIPDVNCIPCSFKIYSKTDRLKSLIGYRLVVNVYSKLGHKQILFDLSHDLKSVHFLEII